MQTHNENEAIHPDIILALLNVDGPTMQFKTVQEHLPPYRPWCPMDGKPFPILIEGNGASRTSIRLGWLKEFFDQRTASVDDLEPLNVYRGLVDNCTPT